MTKIHSTTTDKIIVTMLSEKEKEFSIRKLSELVSIDYKAVYEIVQRLIQEGIITAKKAGNTTLCSINPKAFNHEIFKAEAIRKENILKDKDIKTLVDYFERNMPSQLYVILLFGSYAKRTNIKSSDIDLLFIIPDETLEKSIHRISSMLPLPIHFNVFTEKQFDAMKNSKEPTVGTEAMKNNIVLYGIESYHRLIQ